MKSSTSDAAMTATKCPDEMARTERPSVLEKIPLELRTEIYNYTVDVPTELIITRAFTGSALAFLTRRLPPVLALNHQIYAEATAAHYQRTMLCLEKIVVPSLETLLDDTPPTLQFKRLRHLEITWPGVVHPVDVCDLLPRCPELRVLKIHVGEDILYDTDAESGTRRNKTMQEIDASMNFTRILECGEKLQTIEFVADCMWRWLADITPNWTTPFDEFAAWFWDECAKTGRDIDFWVEWGPQDEGSKRNVEIGLRKRGRVKASWRHDYFA